MERAVSLMYVSPYISFPGPRMLITTHLPLPVYIYICIYTYIYTQYTSLDTSRQIYFCNGYDTPGCVNEPIHHTFIMYIYTYNKSYLGEEPGS